MFMISQMRGDLQLIITKKYIIKTYFPINIKYALLLTKIATKNGTAEIICKENNLNQLFIFQQQLMFVPIGQLKKLLMCKFQI